MDATQIISDSILESDEEESEAENENKKGRPLAKLCILKNDHIPETELPLFMGDNVLGRDPSTCTLALSAPSISKRHATICISVFRTKRHSEMDMEALVWDLGSMNGTHKGRIKLTPNVRYALSDGDRLVLADIPCHFVSCAMNSPSSRGDLRTPVSRNSRLEFPEASRGKGGNKGTENTMCVSRGTKAEVSLTKTPVSASCLSFEQTPVQPQGTLVSESDSESEDERHGKRTRTRIPLASDSDLHKSSPTCSTFLSPANKIVPESEDESPITPSSSFKNEPFKGVNPSKEETEVDMEQQQLLQKQAFALGDDSEEERATPVVLCNKNDQHVTAKLESKVQLAGDDDLPVCTSEVSTNPVPNFNTDSDTDMDGEEEGFTSAGHVTLNSNQVNQPLNTDQFHMDSDTDVDDNEGALHRVPKTVSSSDDHVKPFHVIQPEGIAVDSDTDVDDEPALSDVARKAKPMSSACTADTAPSKQQKDFCLDSDTDVDEEAERECGQNKSSSKTDVSQIQTQLDTNSDLPDSIHAAPQRLSLDSNTDDEAQPTPALSEAPMVFAPTESLPTPDTRADFGILPDSDTDVEADSPPVVPVAATTISVSHTNMSEALQSDSNADMDVEESSVPPAGNVDNPADHSVDSSTDVEYKETDIQISELHREATPVLPFPALQACSTPVQSLGGEVENMDTQAFLSPSVSLRRVALPAVALSSSDSQEEEDFVVAETQSFVLQTRDGQGNRADDHIMEPIHEPSDGEKNGHSSNGRSFYLGLSDSTHLQCQTQDLSMEITQAFVPVDKNLNLEDTQTYASDSTADTATPENASEIEATQAYGVEGESATCSVMLEKDKVHFALEATQAYISEPCSDSENETDEINCPTSSTLATAETQPMSGFEEEESLASETEEREECEEVPQPQELFLSKAACIAETQPMQTCSDGNPETPTNSELSATEIPVEDGESDEDSIPVSRKRKAKPLQLEETQSLCSPGGTQPVDAVRNREDGESDDEDVIPGPRKRKAKPLQLEEEQTQPLTNSELSVVETQTMHIGFAETQPMVTRRNGESDVESEEKKTPTFINPELSAVQTQPVKTLENVESDEEDSCPVSQKRRAKPQQLEETQDISSSEVSTLLSQPVGACEDVGSIKEDSIPGPAKLLQLSNSEICAVETQATVRGVDKESRNESIRHPEPGSSGVTTRNKGVTGEKLKEKEQRAKCSNPLKGQTSGKKQALSKSRRGEQSRVDEGESEEEEEMEQPKKARGNKPVSPQKDEEEEKQLQTETNQQVESISLVKSKHEERNAEKDEKENGVSEAIEREEEVEGQHEEERKEHDKQARFQELDEQQEHKDGQNMLKVPTRGRRTSRRTNTTTTASTNDDVPARRTRSRSNSSNSVSSERSASSITTQEIRGRGRGRGRGGKRISEPPQAATARSSNRRRTVAAETCPPQGCRSRSNSSNSHNSEISSCSEISQSRGRGGRQRGRGRKTNSTPSVSSQSDQNSAPRPVARGRQSRAAEGSTKADSLQAATTRGQQQASAYGSEPVAAQGQSNQEGCHAGEESLLTKRNVRGRRQKAVATEHLETRAVSDGDEAKHNRTGRKREMVQNTEDEICGGKEKAQTTDAAEEEGKENPVQAKRRGRASTQARKTTKESSSGVEVKEESEDMTAAGKRQRGRPSAAKKMKTEEPEDGSGTSVTSMSQDANLVAPQPRTPTSSVSRKRQIPVDSSPVAKTPRSSSASPVASGQLQTARQSYKVLFTGVVDEAGGKVLTRLGGSMAKGVSDMNCLVTDKVRRTVKFLCAVAKGIPIVTTHWLEKSGKAGSFLPPNAFAVKDPEQEKKFSFSLQESLRTASSQLLLQGYGIHVTKSVKPEPPQMKDIISCSGATFLPKMPSSHKLQTVVISCEEDWLLCRPAVSASLPVVTAEFILTGILQQKVDVQAYALPPPATNPQPAGGKGRGRKKT